MLQPYKTSDTPFAAFLHFSGLKPLTTKQDPNDFKREVLVFLEVERIKELENLWQTGKAVGDLKKYYRSYKIVSNMIKQARSSR